MPMMPTGPRMNDPDASAPPTIQRSAFLCSGLSTSGSMWTSRSISVFAPPAGFWNVVMSLPPVENDCQRKQQAALQRDDDQTGQGDDAEDLVGELDLPLGGGL